jgi:hypothetical protein
MRVLLRVFALLLLMAVVGCSSPHERRLLGVEVVEVVGDEVVGGESAGIPESITLAIDIDNGGGAVVLRTGRVRVGYKGRRVLMLTLDEKVRIPRRWAGRVEARFRVNMVHNSHSLALRSAIMRGDMSDVTIDWDAVVRAGMAVVHTVQPTEPVTEVVPPTLLGELCRMSERVMRGTEGEKSINEEKTE